MRSQRDISHIARHLKDFLLYFETSDSDHPVGLWHIEDLVDRAISYCAGRCRREGVSLKRSYAESLPLVECNEVEAVQVVYNLLANAIKACLPARRPKGGRAGGHRL